MNIQILHLLDGAKAATGLTVIIDVFRAFSFECYLTASGVREILPVGSEALSRSIKEDNPDYLLAGERHGDKLPGFDFGNSPAQTEGLDLAGKTVVHTTSAGTQGIENALNADEIITGSLVNAAAIARYIRRQNPAEVSLVCMGLAGKEETEEDTLCARYIRSLLEDQPLADMDAEIDILKRTSGAKFFDPAQQDVFPEADFHLSTQVDRFDFVLRYDRETGCMHRLNI